MYLKKCVLKILQNSLEICTRVPSLIKLQAEDLQIYLKGTPVEVFSCVHYQIFKITIFTEDI